MFPISIPSAIRKSIEHTRLQSFDDDDNEEHHYNDTNEQQQPQQRYSIDVNHHNYNNCKEMMDIAPAPSSSSMYYVVQHHHQDNELSIPLSSLMVEPTCAPTSIIQEILADGELFQDDEEQRLGGEMMSCCSEEKCANHHSQSSLATTTTCCGGTDSFTTDTETRRRSEFVLVDWDQVPPFLRNNPFIHRYYRTYFSYKLCLKSMFRWHNETMNIWTHMLGVFIFIGLSLYTITSSIIGVAAGHHRYIHIHIFDVLVMLAYEFLAINCFLSSSLYHTFNCHSKKTWQICYKCDLSAISGLIGGSFFPALYFQLRCYFEWQVVYISSIAVFALLGMVFPFVPVANKERAIKIFRTLRTVLFVCMVVSAIVPMTHWFIAFKPMQFTSKEYSFFAGLALMLCLYGIGLIFWLARIPERFYPGFFDLIGHSHNIWHVLILIAALSWWYFMNSMWSRSVDTKCSK